MTTVTMGGVAIFWADDPNQIDDEGNYVAVDTGFSSDPVLTFVYNDDYLLNYQYDTADEFFIDADVTGLYGVYVSGYDGSLLEADSDVEILEVSWQDGGTQTATVMAIEIVTGANEFGELYGATYVITIDGSLPSDINDLDDLDDWESGISVVKPTGEFGPGEDIDFADFSAVTDVSEDDTFVGTSGDDYYEGGAASDENAFYSSEGNDTMIGGDDWDQLYFLNDPGGVTVRQAQNKVIDGWKDTDTIENFDSFRGSAYDDFFVGDEGSTQFRGLAGNDTIKGGGGNDRVRYDRDERYGGDQGVNVNLEKGKATDGFGDKDTIRDVPRVDGTNFDDKIRGDAVDNVLLGLAGNDTLLGEAGNDSLYGDDGSDTVRGGDDNDVVEGGKGRDKLFGEAGDDSIKGNGGRDKIEGGAGNDTMSGNGSHDTFVFGDGFGDDIIKDFEADNDKERIDLSDVTAITSFADLVADHMDQVGSDVVIDDLSGNTITLQDVLLSDLDNPDFIF